MDIFSSFENRLKNEINLVKNEYLILEDKTLNIYIEEDTIEYFLEKKSNFFKNFPYFDILKKYEEEVKFRSEKLEKEAEEMVKQNPLLH